MKKKPVKKTAISKTLVKKAIAKKPARKKKKNAWLIVLGIANLLAFLAVIVINYLAVQIPIWGLSTWALADLYPNLFTPAGFAFSIWWLIYLFLFGFVIRQLIDLFKKKSVWITKKVGIRFLLSCAANIGRIFAWHHQQVLLSVIIMLIFLAVLIVIAYRIPLWKKLGTWRDKFLVQIPFSLYLWRISVAIIANIAARLVHIGRNMRGMTDIFWTMLVIIVATIIALQQLKRFSNIIFALVVIRAFIGIIMKRINIDPVYATDIIWTLGICIAIISAGIGLRRGKRLKN